MTAKVIGNEFSSRWKSIAKHDEKEIFGFFGDYRFLSNMWRCSVMFRGHHFPSSENAYQAAKMPEFLWDHFGSISPQDSKTEGQNKDNWKFSKEEWDTKKLAIMEEVLRVKFHHNHDLRNLLLATGNRVLIEGNWWNDTFWGVVIRDGQRVGENHLGNILMRIRVSY